MTSAASSARLRSVSHDAEATARPIQQSQDARGDEVRVGIMHQALGIPFHQGNAVRALRNGDEIFPRMLEAIHDARESVAFITFVYWTGEIAERFASALADAARRGVTVMVILDAVGARPMDRGLVEKMKEAGVVIKWFRPLRTWRVWRLSHRTHRKVLVVDHEVGFTGGVGIADEWTGDARDENEWRDTHFEIRGPAVQALWGAFVGNWMETTHSLPLRWNEPMFPAPAGDAQIQLVRAMAAVGWSDVATAVFALASLAEERLRIATAYFVPDEDLVDLLVDKANSGVEVEVLLPGPHHDVRLCKFAAESTFRELIEAGVKIHLFQPSMMHLKLILADRSLAMVGSANINYRSLRKDDEVILTVCDGPLLAELERHFDEDITRSEPLTLQRLKNRPWWRRLLSNVFYRFRSEL